MKNEFKYTISDQEFKKEFKKGVKSIGVLLAFIVAAFLVMALAAGCGKTELVSVGQYGCIVGQPTKGPYIGQTRLITCGTYSNFVVIKANMEKAAITEYYNVQFKPAKDCTDCQIYNK